MLQDFIFSEN